MIKYTEILKAVNTRLGSLGIRIESESDVQERIKRPCFMTKLDNIKSEDYIGESLDRSLTVRIYYFSSDRKKNKVENLDMIDTLNEIFLQNNFLEVNENFLIEVEEVESDIIDKVVHYNFDISFNEDYIRVDNTENMEELDINLTKEV